MLKNLLYFAILTTFVVMCWVGFGIYHNSITSTISESTTKSIIPISPRFDIETIAKLKSKKVIRADLSSSQIATPTPTIITTPSPTPEITTTSPSTTSGQITGGNL
jgi:hypothetical protein